MAIHRLVLDTIMMKKYMAKSNVVLGRGAPHSHKFPKKLHACNLN